ncbi:MAG TPA: hypothetical protein VNJ10_01320 [Sphingomonas sp.]|nr:hypothetical protein [Sphingomonas sp.]
MSAEISFRPRIIVRAGIIAHHRPKDNGGVTAGCYCAQAVVEVAQPELMIFSNPF